MEVAIEESCEQMSGGRCADHSGSKSLSTYVPREYIRHPNWLPIHYRRIPESANRLNEQGRVDAGGICFKVRKALLMGSVLEVRLPIWKEIHVFHGIVE